MTNSMWTPAHWTSYSKIMGINMELFPPFAAITAFTLLGRLSTRCWNIAAITASTLLGRLSTRCWNIAAVTCFQSDTRALVRLGTDVGRLGLA